MRSRGINSSPSQPQSQPPSSSAQTATNENIPSRPSAPTRPYFYRYPYQYQRPNGASGFHAANQVEFLGPVQSVGNGNQPPKYYKRPNRPHPRPTCTIQGLGGGGSSSGAAMAWIVFLASWNQPAFFFWWVWSSCLVVLSFLMSSGICSGHVKLWWLHVDPTFPYTREKAKLVHPQHLDDLFSISFKRTTLKVNSQTRNDEVGTEYFVK